MINSLLNTDFWMAEYFNNSLKDYLVFVVVSVLLLVLFWLFKRVVIKKLHKWAMKTSIDFDDMLIRALKSISWFFLTFISFYFGSKSLVLGERADLVIKIFFVVAIVYQVVKFISVFINYGIDKNIASKDNCSSRTVASATKLVVKILLWSLGLILILDNLGVDVTSLVAGLGISGIAVALAAQSILSDLFSAFTIYFDKPFEVGDFIDYGEFSGEIEKIGLRTTRIRSWDGEQIVVSNQELTSGIVQNYTKMHNRRIEIKIGIAYDTPAEKVKKVSGWIRDIIEKTDGVENYCVSLMDFNDFSLGFVIECFVNSEDYVIYVDKKEEVMLQILEKFEKEGIEIPFPTTRVITED